MQPLFDTYVPRDMTLAVRTALDASSVTNAIRERVQAIDADIALYNVATMDDLVSTSVAQPRLNLSLLAAFAALALTRVMSSLLFDVAPRDPTTLGAAAAILACVALAACYVPARRAPRIDPLVALRGG